MRKFDRGPEPDFLLRVSERWGMEWAARLSQDPGAQFRWREIGSQPINQLLLPYLKEQTQSHCSFCDAFPVSPPSLDTIEHFRPKSSYPQEAYLEFDRYFIWDFTTGRLEVNPGANETDMRRASTTIRMYRLNEQHPGLRRRELRRRQGLATEPLEEFAYRHYLGT